MSGDVVPLPIWPWPMSPERAALLREAKLGIDTPTRVHPCPAEPGSPGRIFAFGEIQPFAAETVFIRAEDVDDVEVVRRRLDFWLNTPMVPEGTPGTFTHEMWLSAVFGSEVKFLYEESLVKEEPKPESVRFY